MNKISKPSISIISPVYKEEQIIELFCQKIINFANKKKLNLKELILIVDPSNDNTFEILKKIAKKNKKIKIILFSKRFGHQQALLCGLNHVNSPDAVVMLDSDLQHPIEIIEDMIIKFKEGYEVVNTNRIYSNDVSLLNKISGSIFYKIFNKLTDLEMQAFGADFRLISKKVLSNLITNFEEQNYFLRGIIAWIGFKQITIEYKANSRTSGISKFNFLSRLKFAVNGILGFSFLPIKLFFFMGLFFSIISFLLTLFHIFEFLNNSTLPPGWTTLVVLITFYFGVTFIFFGIIAKYISFIYLQVVKRPRYIIDEKIN